MGLHVTSHFLVHFCAYSKNSLIPDAIAKGQVMDLRLLGIISNRVMQIYLLSYFGHRIETILGQFEIVLNPLFVYVKNWIGIVKIQSIRKEAIYAIIIKLHKCCTTYKQFKLILWFPFKIDNESFVIFRSEAIILSNLGKGTFNIDTVSEIRKQTDRKDSLGQMVRTKRSGYSE